jgi:hypothetical protein
MLMLLLVHCRIKLIFSTWLVVFGVFPEGAWNVNSAIVWMLVTVQAAIYNHAPGQ